MDSHDPQRPRTRLYLLLLALLGVFLLLGVVGWLASSSDRIQPGMTRAEVEARLGAPDGRMLAVEGTPIKDVVLVWKDRGIVIEFDEDHCVRGVTRPSSLFDTLRGTFGF